VSAFAGLCSNEWIKLWRHRRVAIGLVGTVALAIVVLNGIASSHGGSWRDSVRAEIGQLQQLEDQIAHASSSGALSAPPGDAAQVFARDLAMRKYLLAHDVAPDGWYPMTGAVTSVFVTSFPILLLLFAGLSAEVLAQERNDQTLALLLSHPVSRRAIVLAKGSAVLAASFVVLLAGLVLSYVIGACSTEAGNTSAAASSSSKIPAWVRWSRMLRCCRRGRTRSSRLASRCSR